METRVIALGSRKKWRNSQEWRPLETATCGDFYAEGDGPLIGKLCAEMQAAGFDGLVEVKRGETPVFAACHVSKWVGRAPWVGEQPRHLSKGAA
jgi:hypothetical protein